jgi:DNA modification methylase
VLDPFFGTGTVAAVAKEHGRDWLGIELNPAYKPLAESRLGVVL